MSTTLERTATTSPARQSWLATARDVYALPEWLSWTLVVFPIAAFLVLLVMMAIPATRERGEGLLVEDHAVENFTPVGYWICTIVSAFYARWLWQRNRRRLAWFIAFIALANFGCGGEEISWGQRMFHWRTPAAYASQNIQGETTIHNLAIFEGINSWFPLILGAGGLWLIATHTRRHRDRSGIPTVLATFCAVMAIQSAYDNYTDRHTINLAFDIMIGRLSEYSEMLVAFAFAIGVGLAFRRDRRIEQGLVRID